MTMQAHSNTTAAPAQASLPGRVAALAYGSVAYLAFLATYLLAIAFVADLSPRSVDTGPTYPMWNAILVNVGLLSIFAVQHSIMARGWFKARWTKICPPAVERSTFVMLTNLILVLIFTQWRPIPGEVWNAGDGALAMVLQGISYAGFGLVVVATFLIDHFELFGMKQVIRFFRGVEHTHPPFLVRSLYRYTRHPLYVGFILAFWATPRMTWGHLLFAGVTTAYLLVAIQIEEGDLIRMHGDKYREYKKRVAMLLPLPGKTW
jgi:protein-S-isoprenylcysteine O-methyltransferase Ste14